MKTIGVYKYDQKVYNDLTEKLESLGILLKPMNDNDIEEDIELYILNIDNPEKFGDINFDRPFLVVSSINSHKLLSKSYKSGALDYIHKPFADIDLIAKRIERILEKKDAIQINSLLAIKYNKMIDNELKRAKRGKYSVTFVLIRVETKVDLDTLTSIIHKVKLGVRDSDTCIQFSQQDIIVVLPFTSKSTAVTAVKKIITSIGSIGYKSYCSYAEYPNDGQKREDLLISLSRSVETKGLYKK